MSMLLPLVDEDHSQHQLSKATKTNQRNLKRTDQQSTKMMNLIKSGLRFAGGCRGRNSSVVLLVLALASSIATHVRCQDFEDLKNNNLQRQAPNFGAANFQAQQFAPNQAPQQQAFQPNRQQQFPGGATAAGLASGTQTDQSVASVNSRSPFQRPVLSNRFAQQQQQQQQQSPQQPASQASASTSSIVSGAQQASGAPASQSASNIDSIMKNALARTAKLEGAESRQDSGNAAQAESRSSSQASGQTSTTTQRDRQAEASESTASTQPVDEAAEKQTTTQSSHETVYSDQRFANLFARRNAAKKSKLVPMEQPKAKPTLPSFIKSLPDPKQFTANPLEQPDRPISSSSSNLVSARLQQQLPQANQNRVPKKNSSVASSSPTILANSNNNKRGQAQKPPSSATAAKPNASAKPGAGAAPAGALKPSTTANNPFNKSQANTSDPANVIAMARRRLLANNALLQKQQASSE